MLLWLRVSLRARGYGSTLAILQKRLQKSGAPATDELRARLIVENACRMVNAAVRYGPGKSSCLEQSLTLWFLLRRAGVAANLRIGVRKEAEKFEAHAWVECEGEALNQADAAHRHYAAFDKEIAEAAQPR